MSNKNNIETNNENNADISREQTLQILRNLYGYTELPSEKNANDLYWNTVLKQANITPAQYEEFKSRYVKRNSVGIIEAISASAANNLYVPLARVAVSDTASYYQVLDTDFTYFTDVVVSDDLILPQNGTFFVLPNQADAHLQYDLPNVSSTNTFVAYLVNNNKIYKIPNYQTLEVELVERKLTYDSIQILEKPYVDAIIQKFKVEIWPNRTSAWRTSFPSIAVYRPFPPSVYLLQTSHDRLYEGQQLLVRLITQRVPVGKKFKYSIEGVDAADIDVPLNGILETAGNEAQAGVILRINTRRDKRSDGAKTLIFNVDIPYDQTYGGGQRFEAAVDILERSTAPQYLLGPAIITRQTNTPAVELRSRNNQYGLVYQSDGNLVVYDAQNNAIRSYGYGSQYFELKNDGDWVIYNANGTINFATSTITNGPVYVVMQDDGNLVLYRMFDDLPIWSSFGGRNNNHNPAGTPNQSILKVYADALSAYATSGAATQSPTLINVRTRYNALPQATKDALTRNTGTNRLAFINPNAADFSKVNASQQATAINEFIGGSSETRRNALVYTGNRTYQAYRDALITASTEINVADIPSPPGRFTIADTPGFGLRGIGSTTPASEAPRGQGAESGLGAAAVGGVAGGASGTGTGGTTGGGTSTPPPSTKPTNPAITLISTNSTSKIESVRITHPTPTSEIKITIGTGIPNTNYTKGSSINISPGQQLRTRAIVNGISSDIVTRINQNTPPPNPPPPGGSGARTGGPV